MVEQKDSYPSGQERPPDTLQVLGRVVAIHPDLSDPARSAARGVINVSRGLNQALRSLTEELDGREIISIQTHAFELLDGSPRQELMFTGLSPSSQEAVLRAFRKLKLPTISVDVPEETDQGSYFSAPELLRESKTEPWSKRNVMLRKKNPTGRVGLGRYTGRLTKDLSPTSTKKARRQANKNIQLGRK